MHGPSCLGVTGNDDSASHTFGSWNTSLFAAGLIAVSVKSLFEKSHVAQQVFYMVIAEFSHKN
jgi:hypothetical protein